MKEDSAPTRDLAIMEQVEQALEANAITARYPFEVEAEGATITLRGEVAAVLHRPGHGVTAVA
jgi:hypothetical protein